MRRLLTILTVTLFTSCNNSKVKLITGTPELITSENRIDYKNKDYNFFLGQTKDSLKSTLAIERNVEAEFNVKAGDSIEQYMNISEDLIKVTKPDTTDVLPALYFTFHKGI